MSTLIFGDASRADAGVEVDAAIDAHRGREERRRVAGDAHALAVEHVEAALLLLAQRRLVARGVLVVRGVLADSVRMYSAIACATWSPLISVVPERGVEQLLVAGDLRDLGGLLVEVVLAARPCSRRPTRPSRCPRASSRGRPSRTRSSSSRRSRSPARGASASCRPSRSRADRGRRCRPRSGGTSSRRDRFRPTAACRRTARDRARSSALRFGSSGELERWHLRQRLLRRRAAAARRLRPSLAAAVPSAPGLLSFFLQPAKRRPRVALRDAQSRELHRQRLLVLLRLSRQASNGSHSVSSFWQTSSTRTCRDEYRSGACTAR